MLTTFLCVWCLFQPPAGANLDVSMNLGGSVVNACRLSDVCVFFLGSSMVSAYKTTCACCFL